MKLVLIVLISWSNYRLSQCVDDNYDLKLLLEDNKRLRQDVESFLLTREKNMCKYPLPVMKEADNQMLRYAKDHWKLDFIKSEDIDIVIKKEYKRMARWRQLYRDIKNQMRIRAEQQGARPAVRDRVLQVKICKSKRDESLFAHDQRYLYLDQEFTHRRLSFKYTHQWRNYLEATMKMLDNANKILWKAYEHGWTSIDYTLEDYHSFLKACGKHFDIEFNRNIEKETNRLNELINNASSSTAKDPNHSKNDTDLKMYKKIFNAIFEDFEQCLSKS